MAVTVDIDHEAGNLTEYTSTATDGGHMSVAAGAALAGTNYGLSCLIADTTVMYGQYSPITQSAAYSARFYLDPNAIAMANNDAFIVFITQQAGGSYNYLASVSLRYTTAAGYRISGNAYDDAGASVAATYFDANITDAPHYIEIKEVQAATDSSADGTFQMLLDGVSLGTSIGFDNYNAMLDNNWRIRIGAPGGDLDAGTAGTFFLDQLVMNNDGALIGPVAAAGGVPKQMMHYKRMRA